MDDSPYRPPQVPSIDDVFVPSLPTRDRLVRVAKCQRQVLMALLANIIVSVLALTVSSTGPGTPGHYLAMIIITIGAAIMVYSMIVVFRLANEMLTTTMAVLFAILMFAPCISLLALLVLNQKATSLLQNNGLRVGFLGVNPGTIEFADREAD